MNDGKLFAGVICNFVQLYLGEIGWLAWLEFDMRIMVNEQTHTHIYTHNRDHWSPTIEPSDQ